jgi:hypothetical protein
MISAGIYAILLIIPDPENFVLDIFLDSVLATALFYFSVRKLLISKDMVELASQMMTKATDFFRTK